MRARTTGRAWLADERGNAVIEFIVIGLLVIVPLLYVVTTAMTVQAATSASTVAVREAARAFTTADSPATGQARARLAAEVAFADHGFTLPDAALRLSCSGTGCLAPGGSVQVGIDWRLPLPWVPAGLTTTLALPIAVEHTAPIDAYRVES